jgi:class 3 adenylate cyclase
MRDIDRRLAAVWFADIVGFTPLADRDEDAALEAVAAFQAAARKAVEGRGGRVVKFLGDGARDDPRFATIIERIGLERVPRPDPATWLPGP